MRKTILILIIALAGLAAAQTLPRVKSVDCKRKVGAERLCTITLDRPAPSELHILAQHSGGTTVQMAVPKGAETVPISSKKGLKKVKVAK
jgi:hypothetical protein